MRKTIFGPAICLALGLAAVQAAFGGVRPAALTGSGEELKAMVFDVISKHRIIAKQFPGKAGGLPVADYGKYAIVAILDSVEGFSDAALWKTPEQCAAVGRYLDAGGKVLVSGQAVRRLSALGSEAAALVASDRIDKVDTVIWRLRIKHAAAGKPLGVTLDRGEYQLTPEGEEVAALDARYAKIILSAKDLDLSAAPNEWEPKPLGSPGTLRTDKTLAHRPVLRDRPVEHRPGLVLYDGTTKARIVATDGSLKALAKELAWHFGEMTGAAFEVVDRVPEKGPSVVLSRTEKLRGHTVIRRTGDRLELGGGPYGASHAVTYLLEAFGCRYLWPGKLGKVIPKLDKLVAPDVEKDDVAVLKVRQIRDYNRTDAAFRDHPGNRGFFAWHGVNDERDLDGSYLWGHYFMDYYQRYFEEHPDWFALQPNGSREQDLTDRPDRPQLCLSSWGLAHQAATNIVAAFRRAPTLRAHSICLPDGGNPSECMCRACRELDPVNAPPAKFRVTEPWHRSFDYVSFSDRVMTFNNRLCELVTKEVPYAKLTCYLYSNYVDPPLKVKPHPALVLLSDSGNYVDAKRYDWARDNIGAWSKFGNMIMWCPCALWGFRAAVPQNFSRRLFDDIETFKVNGMEGIDFDCMYDRWASYSLVYYMAAKAQLNLDRLGYDVLLGDYCEKGFGKAAPAIRRYFLGLEAAQEKAARSVNPSRDYVLSLDADGFEAQLDRAEALAASDEAVVGRIRFLKKIWPFARLEKKVVAAWDTKDNAAVRAAQAEAKAYRDGIVEDPLVYRHKAFESTFHSPNHRAPRFPK